MGTMPWDEVGSEGACDYLRWPGVLTSGGGGGGREGVEGWYHLFKDVEVLYVRKSREDMDEG